MSANMDNMDDTGLTQGGTKGGDGPNIISIGFPSFLHLDKEC